MAKRIIAPVYTHGKFCKVPVYDEMTQSEFNQMLAKGIEQIKRGETVSMDEVFGEIEADWKK